VSIPASTLGTTSDPSLRDRYLAVKERIAKAAKRSGRDASGIVLVAVSKYAEPDQIRELIKLGHSDFGENKVQQLIQRAPMIDEWLARHRAMPGVNLPRAAGSDVLGGGAAAGAGQVRWHMIGHLQRNKARKVVELCRLIHSVDSLRLVEELQLIAAKREKPVEILLQVNCSGEASKFGCAIGATIHLAEQVETMIQVKLRGLMTMAPYSSNPEDSRKTFVRCRELFTEVRESGVVSGDFNILSMGMSGDFEVGIEEGANLVRVGTALFGEPKPGMVEDEDRETAGE
jgi:pyridoxal phosphate enzyme (YggS family)